jgi:hypothetical protein
LYFHPRHLRINAGCLKHRPGYSEIDVVLTASRCASITIHDAGITQRFERRIGKPVILFPEIADDTPPDPHDPLARAIREKAAGRTVVGMIGLEKRKGTTTLVRLAQQAPRDQFFFVFAGTLRYADFTAEEQSLMKDFFASDPEHCLLHLERVEAGARFNSVFCSFDVPFIVYNDFASTSNLVTKAAIFKRYVLATERYIIGEDVRNYHLGLTVAEGDVVQCLAALTQLRDKINRREPYPGSFDTYRELQSLRRLKDAFKEVLECN